MIGALPADALLDGVRVLHDWADEACVRILKCRDAMSPGGRLLIVEQILEPDPKRGRPAAYLVAVQMMAMFGSARERGEEEFATLLSAAGFKLVRVISTTSAVSIIECTLPA